MKLIRLVLTILLLVSVHTVSAKETDLYNSWIKNMKQSPRGPFARIRWFCNDGSVLEPKPYACTEHGGGVQHGEWTDEVRTMRNNGFFIANVYADIQPETFIKRPDHLDILKQMLLEQFLIQADDGWIFRKARYYRGALQTEDEALGGSRLLRALLENPNQAGSYFLLFREAARMLPHFYKNAPTSQMRQLALFIAESDKEFQEFRIKIHVKPEAKDAQIVRNYAINNGKPELFDAYEQLAGYVDEVFLPKDLTAHLFDLAKQSRSKSFADWTREKAKQLEYQADLTTRFFIVSQLSVKLRDRFVESNTANERQILLYTGVLLEDELFRLSAKNQEKSETSSVGQSIKWLSMFSDAIFGTGLISPRQHKSLKERFKKQLVQSHDLHQFHADLNYVSKASNWTERNLQFHFSQTIEHFSAVEPLAGRYVHDRLHSSLMLVYSHVLDRLIADNSFQLGISHDLWGKKQTNGINGLNPGLTKGILRYPRPGEHLDKFPGNSILVLPATTSDLPPVAGIITAGKGNILSHVQLLARNLGIPNVAIDENLLEGMKIYNGKEVVLAVSPKGMVKLEEYHPGWKKIFAEKKKEKRRILKADTQKLEMGKAAFITLKDIRAKDSGKIAGPKAANLGELKHHFPDAVTDGVVIPFGMFKNFLDQPFSTSGQAISNLTISSQAQYSQSMFNWMKDQYKVIHSLREKPAEQKQVIHATLESIREWILKTDPGEKFKIDLEAMLTRTFGPDGSYGVFVRSDTNVEDLPGFTGAGLNLTVPHVVGKDNIFSAIKRVWASPFTQRSFGWRHAFLENPEHVYASVLLMKTVPVEKSGVMVTKSLETGEPGWLTIAVNEGVGGAVSGQTAEELLIDVETGNVTLLSQATEPQKRVVLEKGGMSKISASGRDRVLTPQDIQLLIVFATQLPDRFPALKDDSGNEVPADVEFGFLNNKLVLFQIRPFLDDYKSINNKYLNEMDRGFSGTQSRQVNLDRITGQEML